LNNANQTLTINKGCRIHVHADAPIVVNGTIKVNGLKDTVDRVYFQGDRLDEPYKDYPASWPGIFLQPSSRDNEFTYAVIKNAYQAIGLQDLPSNAPIPKLTLNECVIDNAYNAGIVAFNSSITARNCLISNCGRNLYLVHGGNYQFTHCTVATYANRYIDHKDAVLALTDYDNTTTKPLTATFQNCIFWGENGLVDNEVEVDKKGSFPFFVSFKNVLWKVKTASSFITSSSGIINNQSPKFDSINTSRNYYDFRIQRGGSPAVDTGGNFNVFIDLDGKLRPRGLRPDLGCFERQQ